MDDNLLERIKEYGDKEEVFEPGVTFIPVDNSISNGDESANLISAILGDGKEHLLSFMNKLHSYIGYGHISVTGNISSAHLITMKVLSSPIFGSRSLGVGDEVITTANNVAVINSCRAFGIVPVLVDVDLNTMLPDPIEIEMKVVEGKTKAIIISSPQGSSMIGEELRDICDDFSIMLIEDFGYGFGGNVQGMPVGSYADVVIYSFHSNLLGDAGVIVCKQHLIHQLIEKAMEEDGTSLFIGLGSNKLMYAYLDAQMDKREFYFAQRRLNWTRLYRGLSQHHKYFRFQKCPDIVNPSWTGFTITIKQPSNFGKLELMAFLADRQIGVRNVIGNVFRSESYRDMQITEDELINSDYIHDNSFVIGCNPNMKECHTDYIIKTISDFLEKYGKEETKN